MVGIEQPLALYQPPRFIAGLDVGQLADPSALCVLERDMVLEGGQLEPKFFGGFLQRLPLQTPYPLMAQMVKDKLERLGKNCALVIDATGVGRTVVDEFKQAWTKPRRAPNGEIVWMPLEDKPTIIAITISSGQHANATNWDDWTVPKLELIMTLMLVIERHRLEFAKGLEAFPALMKEAQEFQWKKTSREMDDPYTQWRQGKQDDMLLALAVAVWWGNKYAPRTVPGQQGGKAIPTSNPLLRAGRRVA